MIMRYMLCSSTCFFFFFYSRYVIKILVDFLFSTNIGINVETRTRDKNKNKKFIDHLYTEFCVLCIVHFIVGSPDHCQKLSYVDTI